MSQKLNQSSRRLLTVCSFLLARLILVDRATFLSGGYTDDSDHHHPYRLLNQPVPSGLDQIYNRSISLTSESTNNTSRVVSLVFANANYLEQQLLQNLVCSFHRSQVTNWVVVAMDEKAVKLARNANISHVHFDKNYWKGVKSGRLRKRTRVTNDYTRMIQLRTNFIRTLLYTYNDLDIITSDGDTTWTTRPWETIPFGRDDTDCSVFLGNTNELGTRETEVQRFRPSCGFLMLHNCEATRRLYDAWLEKEVSGGEKEQATLTKVLRKFPHDLTIQPSKWMNQSGPWNQDNLHLCCLDRDRYPNYKYVFKRHYLKRNRDRKNVVVFHPNTGAKESKVRLLKSINQGKQWLLDKNGTCPFVR